MSASLLSIPLGVGGGAAGYFASDEPGMRRFAISAASIGLSAVLVWAITW